MDKNYSKNTVKVFDVMSDEGEVKTSKHSDSKSTRFITRVNINEVTPHVEQINFMHDPSTMIHYSPIDSCSKQTSNNTVMTRFSDISITTTKPSLQEMQNREDANYNSKSFSDSAMESTYGNSENGFLIIPDPSANSNNAQLLNVKSASPGNSSLISNRSSSASPHGTSLSNSGSQSPDPASHLQYRRKVSLMPLVTEEELKSNPMGHKDPISVAQVFGEDFASKFCIKPPLMGSSPMSAFSLLLPKPENNYRGHSPLPYDTKEKMVRHNVSPESTLLPFEIRDKNLPKGVPTVKVRRKPVKLSLQHDLGCDQATSTSESSPVLMQTKTVSENTNGNNVDTSDDTYEVAVALSPIIPKFPSLPAPAMAATANFSPSAISRDPASSVFNFDDIAACNPDMLRFQEEINDWLKNQSTVLGSAFVVASNEANSCFCQVCDHEYFNDPINCGELDFLRQLFDFPAAKTHNASITTSEERIRVQHRRQQLIDNPQYQLQTQNQDTPPVLDLHRIRSTKPNIYLNGLCSVLEYISAPALCSECNKNAIENDIHSSTPSTSSPYSSSEKMDANKKQNLKNSVSNKKIIRQRCQMHSRTNKATISSGSTLDVNTIPNIENKLDSLPIHSIIGIQANCGFVAGLILVHRDEESKKEDLDIILPHISLIATLMSIIDNVEEQKRLAQQTQRFLSMTQNVFSSLQDMNELVRNITREAKALVQAEICSLFLLDKEHSELVAEVFEKNGTSDEYLTEIRMPLTQGIVGHVATTGQMLNVKNVYENPYFYPKVDERTGFVTRNILCFPIKDEKDNLVGVAELCNKIGKKSFTRHDEQCAATFSVYCALSILHCLLYRKLQEAHRRSHMAAELLVQGSTLSIAPEDILRLTVRDIPLPTSFHPEFTHFSFVPRSIGTGDTYVEASLSMFKDLGFIDRYRLRRRTLARFLLMVQKGYRDVPYHNWSHAFAVGHFCYLLIRIPAIKAALTELERFALLVACLCHDIDHRGTTNAFQLQSKTPLAQLYSSEGSVLERHHFAQTVTILGMDECNIFDQLTRQQYQNVLDYIRDIILATDIAAHLRKVAQISKMVHDGYNIHDPNDHHRLMCLLMTASDLSDQSKDFKNSKAIAENIYKEFFSQGDLEKQMGNNPIEMMDRDRACVPKIQLEFMDTVAIPVFEYLSLMLPELRSTFDALELNRKCWTALAEILMEDGYSTGGLDYLRDPELERRVFARLAQKQSLARTQSQSTVRRNTPSIASVLGLTNSGGSRDDNDQELSPRSTRSTTTTTTGSTTENTSARSTTTSFPLSSSSSTEIIQIDTTKAPAVFKQKSKKSKIQ